MSQHVQRPVIFAVSSPTPELSAAQAYHWSGGRAMYANFEGAQEEVSTPHGHILTPSKVQSVYIFPGMALGVCAARAQRIKEEQIIIAARAVASMVSDEDREIGRVLPPFSKLHQVAKQVALSVAKSSYEYNLATALPKPADLEAAIDKLVHDPSYVHFG
jgi:malate dehydrogenase (oxaloacetate-decarboxylating)(NADP+)